MRIPRPPHRWAVSPARAVAIQKELAARVVPRPRRSAVRWVAGVDAAFVGETVVAGVVLWDLRRAEVVEERLAVRPVRFPYVPGLLSFRETPAVLAALRKLRREPDAVLCDAHGLAHPRRFGLACHVGVLVDRMTVGCAKSRLVGTARAPGPRRGAASPLVDPRTGELLGAVLRTQDGVRPVYVSIGHRVDLATAVRLVLACAVRSRLPEPTRLADRLVARAKRQLGGALRGRAARGRAGTAGRRSSGGRGG